VQRQVKAGAILPKSVRNIADAVEYLRQILNPKRDSPLNSLENLLPELRRDKRSDRQWRRGAKSNGEALAFRA